ncbi:MDR family MFS transporter [Myceligenerans salitolerans]|uniref:Multidrug efflux MFS transporter n=1 Tax=Myceligenerans salitolerans TaxID=1230528 RepID=A0ABS3IET6_9MICO|nr:MDR family MFS transporter [Myceligenerans salitolerans]MBO0610904.1 multidrug efflux MFS transporter [Myceligenerans salitolerans]
MPSATSHPDKLDRTVIVTGLVVVAGMIMVVLDTTIVNVALDSLSTDLGAPLSTTQWVVTGYLLAVALVIPLTGWAMDRFGPRTTWITSVSLFVAGSALCAAAWSVESLVAFRILQGLGGGMLLPAGQAIITKAAGPRRLGRAMSILGIPMLLGPVLGPVVGGLLVEYANWQWIFIVNVPVGILAIGLAFWKLPDGGARADAGRLDVRGLVLLSAGLAALLYGLSRADSQGGFGAWDVLGWLLGGGTALTLYAWHSLRQGTASIIDVRLFTDRRFAAGTVAVFLVAGAMFGGMLLLALYYQTVRDEGPLTAGLLLAPQGVGAVVAMVVGGRLSDRFGAGYVVLAGIALALLGTLPFTGIGVDTSYAWLSVALFVRGVGLGAVMMPAIAAAYTRLGEDVVTRAAPTLSAMQQLGASLGSAVLVAALTQRFGALLAAQGTQGPDGGAEGFSTLPPAAMAAAGPLMADAFGVAFWITFACTAVIVVPALFLPRHGASVRSATSG